MEGIELALRFSYIVNTLRYCGPPEASKQFLEYLEKRDNADVVKDLLKRFEGLKPYLSAIAAKTGKNPFDREVVEAYWIGNSLLDQFDDSDMENIIRSLVERGLPKSLADKLIANLPSGFVPHHGFNVFYVGVGSITGAVEKTLPNMDNCRISWGTVSEIVSNKLLAVQVRPLIIEDGKILIGEEQTRTVAYLPIMLDVKKGDCVALHWGFATMILSEEQRQNLEKYTQRVIDVVNQ